MTKIADKCIAIYFKKKDMSLLWIIIQFFFLKQAQLLLNTFNIYIKIFNIFLQNWFDSIRQIRNVKFEFMQYEE